ncbi:DUF6702 family protein [Gilvibacter sp.]|uniref:DUF6702 family protein n=1 Tax=Gilvibacter sp. TaxID=2729997 RepID=UPI0025B81A44|nr:DUF6702 family protein [Gilvibacter sp.]NQX78423.1 hypothetical protein [Gilvibacter sp.]
MKRPLLYAVLMVVGYIGITAASHPIKLTSSLFTYDDSAKKLSLECKVFIDDFSPAINGVLQANIQRGKLTDADIKGIEAYFTEKFIVQINGKTLPFKIKDYEIELKANVLTLHFENKGLSLKKNDKIKVENSMLFESFGHLQSNWMTFKLPPLLRSKSFESTKYDPIFTKTL